MRLPPLVTRRSVWLPTFWGWLALLLLGTGALIACARALYPFLALDAPVGARILVIEAWIDRAAFDQALDAFRANGYERVVVAGAAFEPWAQSERYPSAAQRGAEYLRKKGLPEARIAVVTSTAALENRTYLNAVAVREWARASGLEVRAIDVFSQGAHARRSRLLFEKAFGSGVQVGVRAARVRGIGDDWWRTARGAREVLDQGAAYAWTRLFFRPPAEPQPPA